MKKEGRVLAIGGIFFLAQALLAGCDTSTDERAQQDAQERPVGGEDSNTMAMGRMGVMTVVKEVGPQEYRIIDEYPSNVTGVLVERSDGSKDVIGQEKATEMVQGVSGTTGFGLGAVLASGLFGYMVGKNTGPNPAAYASDGLYRQSLANRQLIDMRKVKKEEKGESFARSSGGFRSWFSWGGSRSRTTSGSSVSSRKTGFFSRVAGSLRGSG
jgi:hypothetical protein